MLIYTSRNISRPSSTHHICTVYMTTCRELSKGCLCAELDRNGELVFAAWHRSAPESPFEWLWDGRAEKDEER